MDGVFACKFEVMEYLIFYLFLLIPPNVNSLSTTQAMDMSNIKRK